MSATLRSPRAGRHPDTRRRVIEAASELFAAHGFHGTTARDIAQRAGVNLAAAHYHFGAKDDLYLEVLRAQFDAITAALERRGARLPAGAKPGRAALEALLRARIAAMLEVLMGPPPGLHGTLMLREMCDPSAALPHIVRQFIEPMKRETEEIIARLEPALPRDAVERCMFSIVGQVFFYRTQLPAFPHLSPGLRLDHAGLAAIADHIATFSLGGMRALRPAPARGGRR
ncbi:CerR family C-terminal domain-containing protein [bacterium]|nr:CerR family C-terminal domain-containing protein [bacterium]